MGRCEKCPINFGITTAENVTKGFKQETLKDEDSNAVRIARNTAMARAAYEQAVKLVDCKYDPDPKQQSEVDVTPEDGHTPSPAENEMIQMLLAGGEQPARPACLEHFQIALGFLTVTTQTGNETVFPDGSQTPTYTHKEGSSGTGGQYL